MSRPATSRVSFPGAKGNGTPASSAKSSAGSSASATAPWSPDRKFTGPSSPRRSRGAVRRRTPGTGSFCDSAPVLETEAVVVGAGPSGATAALLLARGAYEGGVVDPARLRRVSVDEALGDAVRRQPHATGREGERVTGLIRDAAERVVGVATTAGEIRARIVIGADGLHSQVRAWAGLRAR